MENGDGPKFACFVFIKTGNFSRVCLRILRNTPFASWQPGPQTGPRFDPGPIPYFFFCPFFLPGHFFMLFLTVPSEIHFGRSIVRFWPKNPILTPTRPLTMAHPDLLNHPFSRESMPLDVVHRLGLRDPGTERLGTRWVHHQLVAKLTRTPDLQPRVTYLSDQPATGPSHAS